MFGIDLSEDVGQWAVADKGDVIAGSIAAKGEERGEQAGDNRDRHHVSGAFTHSKWRRMLSTQRRPRSAMTFANGVGFECCGDLLTVLAFRGQLVGPAYLAHDVLRGRAFASRHDPFRSLRPHHGNQDSRSTWTCSQGACGCELEGSGSSGSRSRKDPGSCTRRR